MAKTKITKNSDEQIVNQSAAQPVPIQEFEPVNQVVHVTGEVQLYSKPNLNPSLMAGKLGIGSYEVTDVMRTIQGRFFRLRTNKKYILEGPNTILK